MGFNLCATEIPEISQLHDGYVEGKLISYEYASMQPPVLQNSSCRCILMAADRPFRLAHLDSLGRWVGHRKHICGWDHPGPNNSQPSELRASAVPRNTLELRGNICIDDHQHRFQQFASYHSRLYINISCFGIFWDTNHPSLHGPPW